MNDRTPKSVASRRTFLKNAGRAVAASTLVGAAAQPVHAAENNTIQLALIGCGLRGSGAAADALRVKHGPIKLVAMADVFDGRLTTSYKSLKSECGDGVDVPEERKFVGFEAYKHAIDCLKPGDVAIMASPPAFRWVHFAYAVEKGVNVFMEKPVTVDGPSTRRMLKLGAESVKRNLKVGVGLMCRHCKARGELFQRIKDGQIGQIIAMRAYRMHGPAGSFASSASSRPKDTSELLFQIRRFHSFLWASGGCFSDFYIHNIDECCWMKDAWPVTAQATGGRHYRGDSLDQNFDNYSVEYTFADGAKAFLYGRTMTGCYDTHATYAHGAKGLAVVSGSGHFPSRCRIYEGQNPDGRVLWRYPHREPNPYELEWADLVDAIRQDKPYNEVQRGAEVSLVTAMGRMAAHTGQVVTYDEMLNHPHEMAPGLDRLTADSPAPLSLGPDGKYPVPQPGILKDREY